RDVDPTAVLATPDRLVVLYRPARRDLGHDARHLVVAAVGHQHADWLPDRLLLRVAVEALGADVPGHDGPVEPLADDGVVGRLHDRGQVREVVADVLPRARHGGMLEGAGRWYSYDRARADRVRPRGPRPSRLPHPRSRRRSRPKP